MTVVPSTVSRRPAYGMTRRGAIGLGAYLAAFNSHGVRAQNSNQYGTMTPLFASALEVRNLALSFAVEETDAYITKYIDWDYHSRKNALSIAIESGIFVSAESATGYVHSIPNILPAQFPLTYDEAVRNSQVAVINALEEASLPIVPMPQSVTPASIPSIEPPDQEKPSDIQVLGDILFEVAGISVGDKSVIMAFIESDDNIKGKFNELLGAISTKKFDEAISLIEEIFKLMIGSEILRRIPKKAWRKFVFRLSLKCVPVVGWIYLGATVIVAIKGNYHRFSFA